MIVKKEILHLVTGQYIVSPVTSSMEKVTTPYPGPLLALYAIKTIIGVLLASIKTIRV
jgi:hypothetical protein